jgi:hypothetical protein
MTGEVPDIKHLRVFGCKAEAHVPHQRRLKGQDKSIPGRFVGYDEEGRAYKFLPSGKRQWTSTRDIVFDERSFRQTKPDDEVIESSPEFIPETNHGESDDEIRVCSEQMAVPKGGREREVTTSIKDERRLTRAQLKEKLGRKADEDMIGGSKNGMEAYYCGTTEQQVPLSIGQAMQSQESRQWQAAMEEELQSMEEAMVWGPPVVLPDGKKATPLKFLLLRK